MGEESDELRVACFMTLVSFFASQPDVLRVSPKNEQRVLNAAARAIIQSGNVVDSPLTDAGLDGSNEVIQVRITPVKLRRTSSVDATKLRYILNSGVLMRMECWYSAQDEQVLRRGVDPCKQLGALLP